MRKKMIEKKAIINTNIKDEIDYLTSFESYSAINTIGGMEFSGQESNSFKWYICTKIQSQLKDTFVEYQAKELDWLRRFGDLDTYERDTDGSFIYEDGKRKKIGVLISGLRDDYKEYLKEKKEFDEQKVQIELSLGKLSITIKGNQHGKYFESLGWLLNEVIYEDREEDLSTTEKLDIILELLKKKK